MVIRLKLDGYIRVSRIGAREGEGYISPGVQREAIAAYAKELGGGIVHWADDQDMTGGTVDRPAFQSVLERIASGQTDGVVVMGVDRFARSVADGTTIVRKILNGGGIFASCNERIDPRTPEGNYMLNQFFNNAELFLNQIKRSWSISKTRAVARGVHIGPTPIGYAKSAKSEKLRVDPELGPVISDLFKLAATGSSGPAALARWMTDRAARPGGSPYQGSEVNRWLSSRIYLGEVHYGDLVNDEAHEPLTDLATWEKCQREPGVQRRAPSPFLLAGLLRCAHCRYSMGGHNFGGAKHSTPIYRCSGSGCDQGSVITAKLIEDYVRDAALAHLRGLRVEAVDADVDLGELDDAVVKAEGHLAEWVDDIAQQDELGASVYRAGLDARVKALNAKRGVRDDAYRDREIVAVAKGVDDLGHDELGDLLHGMIRHIFIRRQPRGSKVDDRTLIVWSDDPAVIEVPRPHHGGIFEPIEW